MGCATWSTKPPLTENALLTEHQILSEHPCIILDFKIRNTKLWKLVLLNSKTLHNPYLNHRQSWKTSGITDAIAVLLTSVPKLFALSLKAFPSQDKVVEACVTHARRLTNFVWQVVVGRSPSSSIRVEQQSKRQRPLPSSPSHTAIEKICAKWRE